MIPLLDASRGADFQALVNRFYDIPSVQGFALGIDPAYAVLVDRATGGRLPINKAVMSKYEPPGWKEFCAARRPGTGNSPIYVAIYVTGDPDTFRLSFLVPDSIPPGHEVLIEVRGRFAAVADHAQHRPLVGGVSVGNSNRNDGGTLGGFLKERGTNDPEILSCRHVLVDSTVQDVVQQATNHGGSSPADRVGRVSCVVPLNAGSGFTYSAPYNQVDAALAKVDTSKVAAKRDIRRLAAPVTSIQAVNGIALGDQVVFVGKESDDRDAFVFRFISRVKIDVRGTLYNFGDLFEIKSLKKLHHGSLAQAGDSGSWVVHEVDPANYEWYGLLVAVDASTPELATCCFGEFVIDELKAVSGSIYELY